MDNDSASMELSAEDVKAGMNREITVTLISENVAYNGKIVRVRPLRASEFRALSKKVRVGQNADLGVLYEFNYGACSVRETKFSPGAILTPGIINILDQLDSDIINQLGDAIISVSKPVSESEAERFSTPANLK